jgi:hypothetical protein
MTGTEYVSWVLATIMGLFILTALIEKVMDWKNEREYKAACEEEAQAHYNQVEVARSWEDLDRLLPKKSWRPRDAKEYLATKLAPISQGEYEELFNGDQSQFPWG